jgi:hypothetical protein
MKAFEILLTLIIFSVSLIVYYSMFGSVVTAITGAVTNWSNISGTNVGWLPGILVIMAALMPLFALVVTLYVELHLPD